MLPDGPVPFGQCTQCGESFTDDIYRFRGAILCGDCRYFVRHGRWPNYAKSFGGNTRSSVTEEEAAYHGLRIHPGE